MQSVWRIFFVFFASLPRRAGQCPVLKLMSSGSTLNMSLSRDAYAPPPIVSNSLRLHASALLSLRPITHFLPPFLSIAVCLLFYLSILHVVLLQTVDVDSFF